MMTKEIFKNLYTEAGFKSKNELAKALNLSYSAVTQWGCGDVKFPPYLKAVLKWAVKAKKYDEALKSGFDESEKPQECPSNIEALSLENARLREECEKYEALKRALKEALK
ncbi:TPA: hypothetical protein R9130_000566 [Campylobacter upsaliensis]|nr:hypothetical protein [Campylobacter upsaliensis]